MDQASKPTKQKEPKVSKQTAKQSAPSTPHAKRGNRRRGRGKPSGKPTGKKPFRPKPKDTSPLATIRRSFFACHRCSFMFAGLRASLGLDTLRAMTAAATDGWLDTAWSPLVRNLIEGHYGVVVHSDTTYFQGTCPTCGRAFTCSAEGGSAEMTHFAIQADRLAPHRR